MNKYLKKLLSLILVCGMLLMSLSGYAFAAEESDNNLINYTVIENERIEVGESQNVVISIGNGQNVEAARLFYTREDSQEEKYVDFSKSAEDALLFEISFPEDESLIGRYILTKLVYTINGLESEVLLEDIGINASFGLGVDVESNSDAVLEYDDENELSADDFDITLQSIDGYYYDASDYLADNKTVVVIDPGHGGSDPGTGRSYNGVRYNERELVLKIAEYCRDALLLNGGIEVYMTRTDNSSTLMNREERLAFASSKHADFLISIHLNAGGATGAEVWIPNENYNYSIHLTSKTAGEKIVAQLAALGLTNRGGAHTKNSTDGTTYPDGSTTDWYGINYYGKLNGIPAIIVEHAFLDNASDFENYLSSDEKLKALGEADARGIIEALPSMGKSGSERVYLTYYEGVDYSAVYDYEYYIENNRDVFNAYKGDEELTLQHFVKYGMEELRKSSPNFEYTSYRNKYRDLRMAYGNDIKSYYMHYIKYGRREGRTATGVPNLLNGITVYNGVDYSAVYDYNYYISHSKDVVRALGDDDTVVLQHFVNYGMAEGRRAKESFDVTSYKNNYRDLRNAYGSDTKAYYMHYVKYGYAEGRTATGVSSLQNANTVYNGIDYSAVYNYNYYISRYKDVVKALGYDENVVLQHFVNYGMSEGRRASEAFDLTFYKERYGDVRKAYGSDNKAYYMHYINYGIREGRRGV